MARFTFTMPDPLAFWRPRTMVSARPFRTMHLADLDELPRGPGWFDSSWDLEQGLEVSEGLPSDMKLQDWLDAMRRACEPAQRKPAVKSVRDEPLLSLADGMSWMSCDASPQQATDAWGIEGLALV